MANYNVLTLSEPVTDFVATTSPETINVQCSLTEDAQRKRVWAVCKAGGIPAHPYDGVRVEMDVLMGLPLSEISEGDFISLNENSAPVLFYVAKHGYEPELNGPGRSLVVRKDCYDNRQWHTSDVNAYATCALNTWLNGTYKALLDVDIQERIATTKFYYTPGNGNKTVSTLERSIFSLSLTELGKAMNYANIEGIALPIATVLQTAYLNGSINVQWTRSPNTNGTGLVWELYNSGSVINYANAHLSYGSRPAFTLPSDMLFSFEPNPDGSFNPIL